MYKQSFNRIQATAAKNGVDFGNFKIENMNPNAADQGHFIN